MGETKFGNVHIYMLSIYNVKLGHVHIYNILSIYNVLSQVQLTETSLLFLQRAASAHKC